MDRHDSSMIGFTNGLAQCTWGGPVKIGNMDFIGLGPYSVLYRPCLSLSVLFLLGSDLCLARHGHNSLINASLQMLMKDLGYYLKRFAF